MSSDTPTPPDDFEPDLAGADYDFVSDDVDRPGLVADLESLVDGDVRFDTYSRQLYATDASVYQQTPIGVVLPRSAADVSAVMEYCAEREIPVLPRGGGTSLAGQSVNEAVVLDFTRYMDGILSIDSDTETACVEPGCIVANLNQAAEPYGLKFGPDPAWRDKSAVGGAIGNNTTGAHSLVYGKTDAYIEECEVVLADGSVETFGEIEVERLRDDGDPDGTIRERIYAEVYRIIDEESEAVTDRYPDLKRNVSGYNLDVLIAEANGEFEDGGEEGVVNLARLLAGSEGTLGIVTEATMSLVDIPETKAVALLTYGDLLDAMDDVAPIVEHGAAAVEVMDDVLLELARDTPEFSDAVGLLPDGTKAALLVEFYAESDEDGKRQVADLLADRAPDVEAVGTVSDDPHSTGEPVRAADALEAHDEDRRSMFWKMRKAGLPILLSRTTDEKHISFIEDCAVPPEHLSSYVAEFQELLDEQGTFACFYAHAGPGVLHIRPLINTKTLDGIEQIEAIAEGVTDLVVEYGGSVSGEHGDGRARTQFNRKLYGDELWETFRDLKTAFDPDWLLNPGNVCGDHALTEHLRFDPDYAFDSGFDPELNWHNDNGFAGMVELCHGCGGCRGEQSTTGGVMCPTYRAAEEEIQSTRGRANLLRNAMSGDLPDDPFEEEFTTEVMDLCIGCKGCKKNCPSGVDMAKLKAEVVHEKHERDGASLRDRLFAETNTVSRIGSALAPLSNLATKLPGSGIIAEKTLGIARERDLPTFKRETLRDWFESRESLPEGEAERTAVLVADTYTNYSHPEPGKAAVEVLEALGVRVELADVEDTGRAPHSMGFLDRAREQTGAAVEELAPRIAEGCDVVCIEPSESVMLQSDLLDFHDGEAARRVANNSYGVMEYIDVFGLDRGAEFDGTGSLSYHGHCHQKATKKDHHAVGVLRRAGYEVDPIDSTCCGMAGSFGYEAEHYSMSRAIADILLSQLESSSGEEPIAPGASCRTQLGDSDGIDGQPPHPIEKLAAAVR
ncbi:MAG: FAD-binding and (Fe-S)-binding domain-containing protein [Natronomonas sp.]